MRRVLFLATVVVAAILAVYFVADDTPADWLVRLSFAGALTAGVGVVAVIVSDLVDRSP